MIDQTDPIDAYLTAIELELHRARHMNTRLKLARLVQDELHDSTPASTSGNRGPVNAISDPTGNAAVDRTNIDHDAKRAEQRTTYATDYTYIVGLVKAAHQNILDACNDAERLTRRSAPTPDPTTKTSARCDGRIDPTCTQIAADHRNDTGTTITGCCSDCFLKACRVCHDKPREPDRTRCAGCRKRAERERAA